MSLSSTLLSSLTFGAAAAALPFGINEMFFVLVLSRELWFLAWDIADKSVDVLVDVEGGKRL